MTGNADEVVSADIPVRITRRRMRKTVADNKYGNGNGNGYGATVSRIEDALSEQERAFQVSRDKINNLESKIDVTARDVSGLAVNMDKLLNRIEQSQRTNWPLLGAIFGFLPALLGAAVYVVNGQITNSVSPMLTRIAASEVLDQQHTEAIRRLTDSASLSTQADVNSRTDRANMARNLESLQNQVVTMNAEQREFQARVDTTNAEIETQFHAVSDIANTHLAEDRRMIAMLWEKTHPGERYPEAIFFTSSVFRDTGSIPQQGRK